MVCEEGAGSRGVEEWIRTARHPDENADAVQPSHAPPMPSAGFPEAGRGQSSP